MFKLLLIYTLIYHCSCEPRSPKVYNVLITSKKNLAPSQALPVYQPVLRTTSVGLAFTPFLYTHVAPVEPIDFANSNLPDDGVPIQQYVPHYNTPSFTSQQYVPQENPQNTVLRQSSSQSDSTPVLPALNPSSYETLDPKNVIANIKRNPNIPDVPPPALPTKAL